MERLRGGTVRNRVQEEAEALFQGLRDLLCQGRRQCALAAHSPAHSQPQHKAPIHGGQEVEGPRLANSGLWPFLVAGEGDREAGEQGTGAAHVALLCPGGRGGHKPRGAPPQPTWGMLASPPGWKAQP